MSFNNFNPGRTGFGKKITAVFRSLDELLANAEERISDVTNNTDYYLQFLDQNYRAPFPTKPGNPVRSDEFYDLVASYDLIPQMSYNGTTFTVTIPIFSSNNQRATRATGSTTLKSGYAIVKLSQSLTNLDREIRFSENEDNIGDEQVLFKYRIGPNNKIHISDQIGILAYNSCDDTQYKGFSTQSISGTGYTATDYECIACTCNSADASRSVYLNGRLIFRHSNSRNVRNQHIILYLKPGDKLTGNITNIFRINYNA